MPPQPGDFAPGWSDFLLPIASSPVVYSLPPSHRARDDSSRCLTSEVGRNPTTSMKSLPGSVTGLGNHPMLLPTHSHLDWTLHLARSSSPQTSSATVARAVTRPHTPDIPSRRDIQSQGLHSPADGSAGIDKHRSTGDISGYHLSSTLHCNRADTTPRLCPSPRTQPSDHKGTTLIHPKDLLDPRTILVPLTPTLRSSTADNHKVANATTSNRTSVPAIVPIGLDGPSRLTLSDAFDPSTSHPASIWSNRFESLCTQDRADVSITHPASRLFLGATSLSAAPIDPSTVHPASVHTMSLQLPAPSGHGGCRPPAAYKSPASSPPNLSAVHPASISSTSRHDFGPSESRYIHPASSSFRTFDSATTHPASVCSGGQCVPRATWGDTGRPPAQRVGPDLMDNGDARVSHPGWGGFGLAKPQRPRL